MKPLDYINNYYKLKVKSMEINTYKMQQHYTSLDLFIRAKINMKKHSSIISEVYQFIKRTIARTTSILQIHYTTLDLFITTKNNMKKHSSIISEV